MIYLVFLFFLSLLAIFYAYFGYPLSLIIIRQWTPKKNPKRDRITPSVSFIIAAFNEENRINEKLVNCLALDYPSNKLQILVASDGSTDQTNEIVRSYSGKFIELLEVQHRGGKENAQKEAIPYARGEIIVFSDVATILEQHGLREIISNFADPTVGCVSSEDRLINKNGKPSGEGVYVRYEMWLRRLESNVNSLVGLSGSFFAARVEVCQDFSGDVQSDFRTLLSSIKLGLRGVSDPRALGIYSNITDEKKEFERKVRTVLRGMTVFFRHSAFLNIFRYGLFSYQFFCHKLMRWLVPIFLVTALVSNTILANFSLFYMVMLLGQLIFYGLGIYGWFTQSLSGILKTPMYFLIVNTAIAKAWWQYVTGKRIVLWTPSRR